MISVELYHVTEDYRRWVLRWRRWPAFRRPPQYWSVTEIGQAEARRILRELDRVFGFRAEVLRTGKRYRATGPAGRFPEVMRTIQNGGGVK